MLQAHITNPSIRGPAFPTNNRVKKGSAFVQEFIEWLRHWNKNEKNKARRNNIESVFNAHKSLAPILSREEGFVGRLTHIDTLISALTLTALPWIQLKSTSTTILRIVAGCTFQLDEDITQRIEWLAHPSINNLRCQVFNLINICTHPIPWNFWDKINHHVLRDPPSSQMPFDCFDHHPIHSEYTGDNSYHSGLLSQDGSNAQNATNLLQQTKEQKKFIDMAHKLWNIVQKPGIGTINVNTEEEPVWRMTPDIAKQTKKLIKACLS